MDFITIDGGEGGTGAGPLVYADHVALPFKIGFSKVFREFVEQDLHQKIAFGGAGKLGFPEQALLPSPWAAILSMWPVKPCSPSAASRPSAVTPVIAPPASPLTIPGSCADSIPP